MTTPTIKYTGNANTEAGKTSTCGRARIRKDRRKPGYVLWVDGRLDPLLYANVKATEAVAAERLADANPWTGGILVNG